MKYEITDITLWGLNQIRALRAIPVYGVKAGDLGGYVESERNLSQEGDCWIDGNAWVGGMALVSGDAKVYENATVSGNARVYGDAQVSGNAWVSEDAWVSGTATVSENAKVYGNAEIRGNAQVSENAKVFGWASVYGHTVLGAGVLVRGDYADDFWYGTPSVWEDNYRKTRKEDPPKALSVFHSRVAMLLDTVGIRYEDKDLVTLDMIDPNPEVSDLSHALKIPNSRVVVSGSLVTLKVSDLLSLKELPQEP